MLNLIELYEIKQIKIKKRTNFLVGDVVEINFFNRYLMNNFMHNFKGICLKFKRRHLNTSVILRNVFKNKIVEQLFIFYANNIIDSIKCINNQTFKKSNVKIKSNYYFLRKMPRPVSKF